MKKLSPVLFTILLLFLSTCKKDVPVETHLTITAWIQNLQNPWGMQFLPNGDFLFCERPGQVNLLKKGAANYSLIMFRQVLTSEGGLLGLAIDPQYGSNHYVYIYETVSGGNRVVRLKLEDDLLTQDAILLDSIPKANNHDGGALRFGPDGYLYAGTGDALVPASAQDTFSLAGKILRMDRNGAPAAGNPFNNYVWTLGHRNVQGFDWNGQGRMFATEHGPTGEFGWYAHDEVNLIVAGRNYGWPLAICPNETDSSKTPPMYCSGNDTWAPSGCTFIKGSEWGSWEGNFILGALKGERLIRFVPNASGDAIVAKYDTLNGQFMRLRNIIQAPDGALIFSSSNIGPPITTPLVGDDKIYRMEWR